MPVHNSAHGTPFIVTSTRDPSEKQYNEAKHVADYLHQLFMPRDGSLLSLYERAKQRDDLYASVRGILVVGAEQYTFWQPQQPQFMYHPGMAVHRIKALSLGHDDPMVEAMELAPGDSVLDCTAGLCSDLLVASHVAGEEGFIQGIEASLPIAAVVAKGLQSYETRRNMIVPALRRIQLKAAQAQHILRQAPSQSWDVVYFDPMFDQPVMQSEGIAALRTLADYSSLTLDTLKLAARVARRCVVVKDRAGGPWWQAKGSSRIVGGTNRRIGYVVFSGDELAQLARDDLDNKESQ